MKHGLQDYWRSLPTTTYCKDLAPDRPLFRFNVHLTLTYHLVDVFIGRNFIFATALQDKASSSTTPAASQWEDFRSSVVSSCVQSAIDIVDLCQMLEDEVGLARASYTEYTSCRAALLTILAQRIIERSVRLRKASEQGMQLLNRMALGVYSADSEKSQIHVMETAVRRLENSGRPQTSDQARTSTASMDYEHFRNWAMLWRREDTVTTQSRTPQSNTVDEVLHEPVESFDSSTWSPLQDLGWDMSLPEMPFDFGDEFGLDLGGMVS